MKFDDKKQSAVMITNGTILFSEDERKHLMDSFNKQQITLFLQEQRSIHNSILSGIEIVLNKPLVNLLVGGLFMPAIYENLKSLIQITIKRVQEKNIRIITPNESSLPNVTLKILTQKGHIIASLDRDTTDKDLYIYIKALIQAANSVDDNNDAYNPIYRIIEKDSDGSLLILTLNEYLKKHNKING